MGPTEPWASARGMRDCPLAARDFGLPLRHPRRLLHGRRRSLSRTRQRLVQRSGRFAAAGCLMRRRFSGSRTSSQNGVAACCHIQTPSSPAPSSPAPLPKSAGSSPSTRLADVFAKYSSQPLKTGTNGDTQLAAGLKQVLKYAYNGESIFPDGNSYAIIHLVDRQGVANGVKAVQAQAEQAMQNAQNGTANTTLAKKATASGKSTVSKKGTNE